MEWIKVEDRLPETHGLYGHTAVIISYTPKHCCSPIVCGAFFQRGEGGYEFVTDEGLAYSYVTHWMHLPSPPNED